MLSKMILRWAERRAPDFVIGGASSPYLERHWLLPRNPLFNVYVHKFLRSDDDRALHDHPWLFNCSVLLKGRYVEHTARGAYLRNAGDWKFRWGPALHRVALVKTAFQWKDGLPVSVAGVECPCWTVFVTGPRVREWGFLCMRGWVHWREFTSTADKGAIGKGCAE